MQTRLLWAGFLTSLLGLSNWSSGSLPSAAWKRGNRYSFPNPTTPLTAINQLPLRLEKYQKGWLSLQLRVNKHVDVHGFFAPHRIGVQDF